MQTRNAAPGSQAGIGLIELMVCVGLALFLLLASMRINRGVETGLVESDRRVDAVTTVAEMLDRLDACLRSSSMSLRPIRAFDATCPLLHDQCDNDYDNLVDELDESFPLAEVLEDQQEVTGLWFQRVLDVDDSAVPPSIVYEAPSCIVFQLDPGEQDDGVDNDGDGLVDEGYLLLATGRGEHTIARGVTDFRVLRNGASLVVKMRVERPREGLQSALGERIERVIRPRNR